MAGKQVKRFIRQNRPELLASMMIFGGLLGLIALFVLGSEPAAAAKPNTNCSCDVQRKQLYLECLHEFNIGSVNVDAEQASERCAAWAGVAVP